MNSPSFGGVWRLKSKDFPGEYDYMCIDEARGRMINFVLIKADPVQFAPMRAWFRWESETSIATKLHTTHPSDLWTVHDLQIQQDQLLWKTGESEVLAMSRICSDELPAWLDERLATENLKMDASKQTSF